MVKPRTFRFALVVVAASAAACQRAGAETVLLDFTSEHCPPCREMEPILRQLTSEGYAVRQVDVNRDRDLARRFSITVTPTFVVLVDGREWARLPSATSHRQLVEMLHKATELAHAHRPTVRGPSKAVGGAGVANVGYDASQMGPTRAAVPLSDEPQERRVVAIQNPFAPRSPDRAAAALPSRSGVTGFETAASAEHLIAATVRLSVADPDGRSTGTGVVVDARNGFALVLTCGHLFRESQGEGAIQVSQFAAGPGGAELRGSVPGELLDFDLDRDLALVRFAVNGPVNVAPVAPPGTLLEPGAAATSVGCNHGDPPTPLATRITALNRYQGHPNVEAAGAPTEGRSGGGLFNGRGQLIGVCFAADPQGDEGLYASLTSIHEKLRELNMATVFEAPAGGGAVDAGGPMAVASAPPSPFAVRGQSPAATDSTTLPESWPSASAPTASAPAAEEATPPMALAANTGQTAPPAMTPDEQATLAEIARRGVGSEVICIIRPQSPDGRSDVIKISGASPAFVQALAAARTATSSGASAATAAAPAGYLR